jgi:hypothetical protein
VDVAPLSPAETDAAGRPRTSRPYLGIKGSPVHIVSARHGSCRSEAVSSARTGPPLCICRAGEGARCPLLCSGGGSTPATRVVRCPYSGQSAAIASRSTRWCSPSLTSPGWPAPSWRRRKAHGRGPAVTIPPAAPQPAAGPAAPRCGGSRRAHRSGPVTSRRRRDQSPPAPGPDLSPCRRGVTPARRRCSATVVRLIPQRSAGRACRRQLDTEPPAAQSARRTVAAAPAVERLGEWAPIGQYVRQRGGQASELGFLFRACSR